MFNNASSIPDKMNNIAKQLTTTIQEVKSLTQDVGDLKQDVKDLSTQLTATTYDVGDLKQEVRDLGAKLDSTIKDVSTKIELTSKDINITEAKLEVKIEQGKNQVILWVVGLFLANGVLTHFLK